VSVARPKIAIVGGGFTGAAIAFHLARAAAPADVFLFEPRDRLGAGLAYGGPNPIHRINVPASRMSLLPDDDKHFVDWLEDSGVLAADPEALSGADVYARRQEFGRYVDEALRPFVRDGAIVWIKDRVEDARRQQTGWRIATQSGHVRIANFLVIATTHPAPSPPRELAAIASDRRLIADGLADEALSAVGRDDRVAVVGAGLTAADIVASLDARGHRGRIMMISRRGLRPRSHPPHNWPAEGDFASNPARSVRALVWRVRAAVAKAEAEGRSWHPVFDALRAQGGDIWAALAPDERRRLVRHLRPFWDVHRFRAAPQIDAVIDRRLADGTLKIVKGRLVASASAPAGISLKWRDRQGETVKGEFDRIVVATGPAHGAVLKAQAYLAALAADGFVTLDATGLGLGTSRDGRAIGAAGAPEANLFVAGPLARGAFGELMGLPQVTLYAKFIADQLLETLCAPCSPLTKVGSGCR